MERGPEITASGQAWGGSCTPNQWPWWGPGHRGKVLVGPGSGAESSEGWRGAWGSPSHRPLQMQLRAQLHHTED